MAIKILGTESTINEKCDIDSYTRRFDAYLCLNLAICCSFEQNRQSFSARLKLACGLDLRLALSGHRFGVDGKIALQVHLKRS